MARLPRPKRPMTIPLTGMTTLLQVFDMPRAVAFYRDVLGFEVVETSTPRTGDEFDWGLLRRDGIELMLNTMYERDERPATPDPARVAAHRDTTLFIACPDLDAAHRRLGEMGFDLAPPVERDYGMRQLGLRDPDGYGVCLQWTTGNPAPLRVRTLVPCAHVRDVQRSIDFYRHFGFEVGSTHAAEGENMPTWVFLHSGSARLMLARASAPVRPEEQAILFYLYCPDVGAMHAAFTEAGMAVGRIEYPFYCPDGEFRVTDPDGYALMVAHL